MPALPLNDTRKQRGTAGEQAARAYLEQQGYTCLAQNWRAGRMGELDLVMRSPENILVFVEVKTRRGAQFGSPLEGVSARQQAKYARLAECFVAQMTEALPELSSVTAWRFDVMGIIEDTQGALTVTHYPQAF